jgi:predicted nuclease of restriction endonuclease-like (RecB) superfamily
VLEHQIKADLRRAVGAAPTNFTEALEAPDSELAQQLVKDPYVFEHLAMVERVAERDVEQALMDRLQDTMLELGRGMALGRRAGRKRSRLAGVARRRRRRGARRVGRRGSASTSRLARSRR